jgi:hypothetical protein
MYKQFKIIPGDMRAKTVPRRITFKSVIFLKKFHILPNNAKNWAFIYFSKQFGVLFMHYIK